MGVISFQPIQEGTGTASPENIRIIRPALHLDGIGDVGGGEIDTVSGLMTVTDYVFVITKDTNYEFLNNMHLPKAAIILPYNGANRNIVAYSHGEVGTRGTATRNYQQRDRASSLPYSGLCTYVLIGYPSTIEGESSNWREWLAIQGSVQVWYKLAVPIEYQLTTVQLNQALSQLGVPISSMQEVMHQIAMDSPHLITPTAAELHTFETNMVAPLKECKIHFEPVQEGEGDPSQDNVRPITGWTGIELYRAAKNLINSDLYISGKIRPSGSNPGSFISSSAYGLFSIPVPKESTIFWHKDSGVSAGGYLAWSGSEEASLTAHYQGENRTITNYYNIILAPERHIRPYIYCAITKAAVDEDYGANISLQVEIGDAFTGYEPPSGKRWKIDWANNLGEIPGGYIDLVRGALMQEWGQVEITDASMYVQSGISTIDPEKTWCTFRRDIPRGIFTPTYGDDNGLFNLGVWQRSAQGKAVGNNRAYMYLEYRMYVVCVSGDFDLTTADGRANYVADIVSKYGGLKVVYKLETPIAHQLDSVTLKTLRGLNNIWSNANGNIDLAYWTH